MIDTLFFSKNNPPVFSLSTVVFIVLASHVISYAVKWFYYHNRRGRGEERTLSSKASELVKGLGLVPHPEGGFFLETFRSGCSPMTTMGQSGYSVDCPTKDLVECKERVGRRPDKDTRRNCLTSIYWFPTSASPKLWLAVNQSDHVHYYHGGAPFVYFLVTPGEDTFKKVVLGPDWRKGQQMQVAVKGGTWKCGILSRQEQGYDYCLIGEGVGPGFDFHDFTWVTAKEVKESAHADVLLPFVKELQEGHAEDVEGINEYYEEGEKRQVRKKKRL